MILIINRFEQNYDLRQTLYLSLLKYNNMDACDEYSKIDSKDAKILALTTRLENLEKSTNANSAHAKTGGDGGGNNLQGAGSKNNNPTGNM